MTLVVRELVIKATLEQADKPQEEAKQPAQKQKKIVSECIEQVIEIMNGREER